MTVWIGSARSDERGKATGGRAGDQKDGREVSIQSWYRHKLGWRTFRCKDPGKAKRMAEAMSMLCDTNLLGYDQWQRGTLYDVLEKLGWDLMKLDRAVETDCSALIRVCAACAGIFLPDFTTRSEAKALLDSGEFVEMKGGRYNDQSAFLGAGDVQVTCSKGHTVMVLTNGPKYDGATDTEEAVPGERILKAGMSGGDVKQMQTYLIELGYDLGKWGADGDFGDCTELALMEFQRERGCRPVDGEYGPITHAALMAALEEEPGANADAVTIGGGQCWVRDAPEPGGRKLGVAKRGTVWPFLGEISDGGWLKIDFGGAAGWVSGKYGKAA